MPIVVTALGGTRIFSQAELAADHTIVPITIAEVTTSFSAEFAHTPAVSHDLGRKTAEAMKELLGGPLSPLIYSSENGEFQCISGLELFSHDMQTAIQRQSKRVVTENLHLPDDKTSDSGFYEVTLVSGRQQAMYRLVMLPLTVTITTGGWMHLAGLVLDRGFQMVYLNSASPGVYFNNENELYLKPLSRQDLAIMCNESS